RTVPDRLTEEQVSQPPALCNSICMTMSHATACPIRPSQAPDEVSHVKVSSWALVAETRPPSKSAGSSPAVKVVVVELEEGQEIGRSGVQEQHWAALTSLPTRRLTCGHSGRRHVRTYLYTQGARFHT
ncbi:hypothetical protein BaRGS_00005402, partial [Batillaria attramentaria]